MVLKTWWYVRVQGHSDVNFEPLVLQKWKLRSGEIIWVVAEPQFTQKRFHCLKNVKNVIKT